ncbi:hypothetical protein HC931_05420 [Candidatus Gracilibacteria bacterium]|nr:hypothetical protein [Candidatus Gracilibacteria bacterium]NJM89091.1 hypothetical protein [Hydrococcus sp. RU_2_2]
MRFFLASRTNQLRNRFWHCALRDRVFKVNLVRTHNCKHYQCSNFNSRNIYAI